MHHYRSVRIVLIFLPVIALFFFAYRYINPSGVLDVVYNFCKPETPYISGMSPIGRVLELDTDKCKQSMVIDPVYFDVRVSQSYRTVKIFFDVEKSDDQEMRVGVGIDPDNWQWEFAGPENNNESDELVYSLDLARAQFHNNRYRFIISAPNLTESDADITLHNVRLHFVKEPLSWSRIMEKISL